MRLKTLMEEKHLDFNQPLLTVRRLSSTPEIQERRKPENSVPKLPPLPFYRSELKSGPMSKPGTVPFRWEQAPGRPKSRAVKAMPNHAPKLPPGRITQIPNSDKDSDSVPESSSCSENDDESYLDALDTFSRSGSCFIDSPVSSRRFSSEQPGRDFMMGRFLPAAKAAALEAVPARKPHIPQIQPRPIPIRLSVNGEMRVADIVVCNEIDSDEIEDLYDDSPAKLCGLLPRFCVLNPVPGLKIQAGRTHSVRTRISKSPYGGSGSDLGSKTRGRDGRILEGSNLYKRLNGTGGFSTQPELAKELEKGKDSKNFLELLASEGSKWGSGSISPVVEKTLYVVSEPKTDESNQQTLPDTSKIPESERDLYEESSINDSGFMIPLSLPKIDESTGFMIPPHLPKTVKHSDSEPKTDESNQESRHVTSKIPEPERDICEESAITEPSFMIPPPLPKTDGSIGFMIPPHLPKTAKHSDSESKTDESSQQTRPYTSKIPKSEQDLYEESAIIQPSFMIPPPLPKTPSDSWLSRALDSKKSASRAFIGSNVLDRTVICKTVDGSKWETIVKTSKSHHGHLRFSEELLLPPIAEV